jgi:heme A synthase
VLAMTLKLVMMLDHVALCAMAAAAALVFYGVLLLKMNKIYDPEEQAGNKRLKWIIGIMTVLLIIGVVPSTRHYLLL